MQAVRNHVIMYLLAFIPFIHSCAMATEKVLLWPAIEGQILNSGKPVSDLELIQTLYWNYEENKAPPRVLTVKTDENGRFVFPKITGEISTGFLTRLFYQPGIVMEIGAEFQGKSYSVDISGSSSHLKLPESTRVLKCDLQNSRLFEGTLLVECERIQP
ncbi:DUF6795 domain-containing protein [Limnobacter sp.]|uniref:DUF6795 domain-containing protein n=1 Tax=Limnobacter sp. TaxID=2003368 RepID=UPI002FE405FC